MKYINESIVVPCPTDELLLLKEKMEIKATTFLYRVYKKMNEVKGKHNS